MTEQTPTTESEARCGTCVYFSPQTDEMDELDFGYCTWAGPVPLWHIDSDSNNEMQDHDGKNCQTYSRKTAP